MFNEILTGKQSLDQPAVSKDPYRVESVPEVIVTCVDCRKDFKTTVRDEGAMRCPSCHIAFVESNQAASARALREAEARVAKSRRNRRLYVIAISAFFGIAAAFTRYQMKKDFAEAYGNQSDSGYVGSYSDDYSYALYDFSADACRCDDLQCARDVQVRVDQFVKRAAGPTSGTAREQGNKSLERIAECIGKLDAE